MNCTQPLTLKFYFVDVDQLFYTSFLCLLTCNELVYQFVLFAEILASLGLHSLAIIYLGSASS